MEVKLTSHFQKVTFPAKFSTSVNEKHYSNTEEVIKHLQEIALTYVFRAQKTEAVTSLLQEQKILNEYAPNNMTNFFQVLDLTVSKWVKDFLKQKFNEWFAVV